jgi:DNA-binding response OmpR family regulator
MSAPGTSSPADAAAGSRLPPSRTHLVVVYSDDEAVRTQVRTAVGRSPAPGLGRIEWVECGSGAELLKAVDEGGVEVCILDGEAWPTGGMGLAKQMKDELRDCPHTMVLIARRDDAWLATWSLADAVVAHPVDPAEITSKVADLLRARESALPVRRAVPLGR